MKFSELLNEAIRSCDAELSDESAAALSASILELLQAWIAIHEPDGEDTSDPQRALVLHLMEELEDRIPIPVVT